MPSRAARAGFDAAAASARRAGKRPCATFYPNRALAGELARARSVANLRGGGPMPRRIALLAVLAVPLVAAAAPPQAGGRIESAEGEVEILGRPLRAGDRIELPEGYLQVEEDGTETGEVGSFTVVSSEAFAAAVPASQPPAAADEPAPAQPGASPCKEERRAYLAELWRQSGIEVSDPAALIEGLDAGGSGPASGYWWFALATDPFRPLAWSSELRTRADALARCVRRNEGAVALTPR